MIMFLTTVGSITVLIFTMAIIAMIIDYFNTIYHGADFYRQQLEDCKRDIAYLKKKYEER